MLRRGLNETASVRLPRLVECDPRHEALLRGLHDHARPLWSRSEIALPVIPWTPGIRAAAHGACLDRHVVRGLEAAERVLARESRGLRQADRDAGAPRGERVSRLLILANDGAVRFYRNAERLLLRHAPRLMALGVDTDGEALGSALFGPGRLARLVLLTRKEAVSSVLLAVAAQWETGKGRT